MTSFQSSKSSKLGMKSESRRPCEKLSIVFASTPNVSMFASIRQNMAETIMNIPPIADADCPSVNAMNMIAQKNRLVLNLDGSPTALKKSAEPKPSTIAADRRVTSAFYWSSSVRVLHIAPQRGHSRTLPPYAFGHVLQKPVPHPSHTKTVGISVCIAQKSGS